MNSLTGTDGIEHNVRNALSGWDIPDVESVDSVHGRDHVLRIGTAGDAYVLKDVGADAPDVARLEFLRAVLEHLAGCGLVVPVPIRSRLDQIVVQAGGRYFLLYKFIEEGALPDDPGLRGDAFHRTGQSIAELHRALASYPDGELSRKTWREDFAGNVPGWLSQLRDSLPVHQSSTIRQVEDERGDRMRVALQGLPEQLIHRDCHPGNVLVDGVYVVAFIDCDHFCIGPRLFDLASYAVHHVKWCVADRPATDAWLRDLPRLIAGYRSRHSLVDSELHAFPYMMMTYHILLSHWFQGTSQMDSIRTEVEALGWMHDNFERIASSVASG